MGDFIPNDVIDMRELAEQARFLTLLRKLNPAKFDEAMMEAAKNPYGD